MNINFAQTCFSNIRNLQALERAVLEPHHDAIDQTQAALDAAYDRCIEMDKDALQAIGEQWLNISVEDVKKVESFGETYEQAFGELIVAAYIAGKTTPLAKLFIDKACTQMVEGK